MVFGAQFASHPHSRSIQSKQLSSSWDPGDTSTIDSRLPNKSNRQIALLQSSRNSNSPQRISPCISPLPLLSSVPLWPPALPPQPLVEVRHRRRPSPCPIISPSSSSRPPTIPPAAMAWKIPTPTTPTTKIASGTRVSRKRSDQRRSSRRLSSSARISTPSTQNGRAASSSASWATFPNLPRTSLRLATCRLCRWRWP